MKNVVKELKNILRCNFLPSQTNMSQFCSVIKKKFFIPIEFQVYGWMRWYWKMSSTRTTSQSKWILHSCVWNILWINFRSFMQCNWQIDIHWIIYWLVFFRWDGIKNSLGVIWNWIKSHVFWFDHMWSWFWTLMAL